jgi:ABC-type transport system substrate-binding protein
MHLRRALISLLALIVASIAPQGVAADWADPAKVFAIAFPTDVTGLDPAGTQETYASLVEQKIFDALYVWDYLARPYRFVPSIATGMPEISADGRVWTIRIRPGIYFTDDPAFAGKKRELTAADFVYAWKRIVDPRVRSPNSDLLEHKIVGLDDAVAKAKSSGRFDYDAEIQGLRAADRYTLKLELIAADYTFFELLDSASLRAVARDVIEKYADASGRAMNHPVGTGPYRLKEWQPGHRIILEANPGYRDERFPPAPANADAAIKAVADSMKGKRVPQIGRIEIAIIEETNPRLLMFNAGQLDMLDVPGDVAPKMIDGRRRCRRRSPFRPMSKGTCPDTRACRPTILPRRGRFSTSSAIAIETETGSPSCRMAGRSPSHQMSYVGAVYRQFDDLWQRSMRDVGIRMDFQIQTFPEGFKAAHAGQLQFSGFGWNGDIADDFVRLFYGPYAGAGNLSRFRNAEYDALYDKSRRTPDTAERNKLYEAMTKIVSAQAPWCTNVYRISSTVVAPRIRGYRKNVHYFLTPWQYLDIDTAAPTALRQ